jgi:signal transduction histidine kinase
MRYLSTLWVLFLTCFITHAQQLFEQNYPVEVYQGASQSWAILQDKHGVIYVANTEGLLRYDGTQWDLISLPNREAIYYADIDYEGNIYTSSTFEIGVFRIGAGGKYEYHSLTHEIPSSFGLDERTGVRVFNNEVFFCNENRIYIYTNGKFKIHQPGGEGFVVSRNNIYLRKGSGLHSYNKNGFSADSYFAKTNAPHYKWFSCNYDDKLLALDDKNQVWLVNEKKPDDDWEMLSKTLNKNLKNLEIKNIVHTSNDNIVVHTGRAILFFYASGEIAYRIDNEDLLEGDSFVMEDHQHNLWFNADSNILQVIASSPISYYDSNNGLKGFVMSFGSAAQYQYIGTTKGLFYENERGTFTKLPGVEGGIWNLYNFHNTVYACHDSSVQKLYHDKAKMIIKHPWVMSLCSVKKSADHMIMGTYNTGIWLLQNKNGRWHKRKIKGFEEETRNILEDEEGNLWISHINKGIWKLKLNEDMDSVISNTFYDKTNGLPSNVYNKIHLLKGKIVVSTKNGIYSYNKNHNSFEQEDVYNRALGSGFCIYTLAESPEGDIYFWGAHPKGKETVGVLQKQRGNFKLLLTPFNKIATSFRNLRVAVDAPILVTNSGEIWIGNDQKVYSYNPNQRTFYNDPIHIYVKKVWAGDSLVYDNYTKTTSPVLHFAFNNLKFEFRCSSLESTEMNHYQYKIEGFENKWSEWSTSREAHYTNLPAGDYVFYVRAKNIYDVISEPASFRFHINPPWYSTRLAYVIYIGSLFILVYLLVRYSVRREKKQKMILEEIVNEKTKELIYVNNLLSNKNDQLQNANTIIEGQNEEIRNRNETLEDEVHKRTKELVEYNQQLEQFAFVTAHNLRGPVARMLGLGTVLRMTGNDPEETKIITARLLTTAEEIDSVIKDLNQILHVKNTPNQLEKLNLQEEISEVISSYKREINNTNTRLSCSIGEVEVITTSRGYLRNIVYQLLGNCIKFRHPDRTPDIRIVATNTKDYICLTVSDNGLGMHLQKIGDKLFTLYGRFHLHIEGKGIGMYLAKTQLLSLGGKIEVDSEENVGTTVKVFFRK